MRSFLIPYLILIAAHAADRYVCDVPPNGTVKCMYPNRSLQRAFDEAAPGDTIYLQPGYRYVGGFIFRKSATAEHPITVTSSRPDWLPGPYSRVTPSHLPNMPVLQTRTTNIPALSGMRDRSGAPPSHWHFVGIGFEAATQAEFDNAIIHTAGMGVNGWVIRDRQDLPEGLVFDRVYVSGPLDDSLVIQNAVRLNGIQTVFKNSFIQPIYCRGIECHAIVTQTHPGRLDIVNNFISAASIPLFTGGTDPDYPGALQRDLTARYNYLFRPLKWWSNPGNPQAAYFRANQSRIPCTKNLLEYKSLDRALNEYNVHENIWNDNFCMGQYTAFTVTVRQNYWESPAAGGGWGGSVGMGRLTTSGTSFSWTGNPAEIRPSQNVCGIVNGIHDCRKVVSVDNSRKQGTVSAPFTFNDTTDRWLWVTDDTPLLRDVVVQNSVFRNAAQGINLLARDKGTATASDVGRLVRISIRNNLFENTLEALFNSPAVRIYTQEQAFTVEPTTGARDISFDHNTFAWRNRANNVLAFVAEGIKTVARIENLSIRSNIFPKPVIQPDGNIYALTATDSGFNDWGFIERFAGGKVNLSNNYLPRVSSAKCRSANCAGNFSREEDLRFDGDLPRVAPKSPLWRAGHDHADVGANIDQLPLIRGLKVTPGNQSAVLEFDLNAPVADAGKNQPCVLEVSSDENLNSYLGPYKVVDDLNPVFFKQGDASNRASTALPAVVAQGGHVRWPIGQNRTVQGDDGKPHNLALRPGARYWGRLMCYGDTRAFEFTVPR